MLLNQPLRPFSDALATLAPSYAATLRTLAALPDKEQHFAASFWLLHQPELRPNLTDGLRPQTEDGKIDPYRDNWWCAITPPVVQPPGQQVVYTNGLSPLLQQLYPPSQPAHRALPVTPAASRKCSGSADPKLMKDAFEVLHRSYPNTTWAKSTRYWY